MAEGPWRRRLLLTVVGVGVALTVVAFLQAVSPEPRKIYGLWRPRWDWAVFGPYVNRNHFAGYLVMAAPLAIGFALEAISRLRAAWGRRRRGWLLLGERRGQRGRALVGGGHGDRGRPPRLAVAGRGLRLRPRRAPPAPRLAPSPPHGPRRSRSSSRSASSGSASGACSPPSRRGGSRRAASTCGATCCRWSRASRVFGAGWNAFATAFPWYQTVWKTEWIGEAHNDYLQALLDGGRRRGRPRRGRSSRSSSAGRSPAPRARRSTSASSAPSSASPLHELVDFNGQIPANAATWIALAALAVARRRVTPLTRRLDARRRRPLE